ncbi:apyrase-like [Olea europaea subsp. europaea]|uniref:Apyrase-like n=1 Tax=Olea europaea subsp. europaea TaxID=158383 RepID=A0A8S0PFX2_OLEEU|nr:apyrase-like [Olea europaea subsp. europaea]
MTTQLAVGHGLLVRVLVVLFLLPVGSLSYSSQIHGIHGHKLPFRRVLLGHDTEKYAVIFDAGSTGSRVHVFRFDESLNLLPIGDEFELFASTKPGLSSYAADPPAAATSLKPLLEEAEDVVPTELRPDTPVRLGATAGLRLLQGDAAERILEAVRNLLKNESTLKYRDDWVSILDGNQEGTYLWVTINYLLDTLGKKYSETICTIDLGGGSVQMAYAISDENAENAPMPSTNETYVEEKTFNKTNYNLYVHSYLNYGSKAGRAEIFKTSRNSTNPCILEGYDGTYTYGGVVYKASAPPTGTNMKRCRVLARKALKINAPCKYKKCTFNGIWNGGGGDGQKNVYMSSSFYWTAREAGILESDAVGGIIRPLDYMEAAKLVCATKFEDIKSNFPNTEDDDIPYLCMDLVYQYTLLVDGFDVHPRKKVTVVNKVNYKNSELEAAWPLGCAIDVMSSSATNRSIFDE